MVHNKEFHDDIDRMFKQHLCYHKIMIKDVESGKVLDDINYSRLLFDSELNIFKRLNNGQLEKVNSKQFVAIIPEL